MKKYVLLLLCGVAGVAWAKQLDLDTGCKLIIQCGGESISDLGIIVGSPTGTPPSLMYENYIGSIVVENSSGMPGSGKRLIFCKGECLLKK